MSIQRIKCITCLEILCIYIGKEQQIDRPCPKGFRDAHLCPKALDIAHDKANILKSIIISPPPKGTMAQ